MSIFISLIPKMIWVSWIPIHIRNIHIFAIIFNSLFPMMCCTKRLPIRLLPEQRDVVVVGLNVVNNSGGHVSAFTLAHDT